MGRIWTNLERDGQSRRLIRRFEDLADVLHGEEQVGYLFMTELCETRNDSAGDDQDISPFRWSVRGHEARSGHTTGQERFEVDDPEGEGGLVEYCSGEMASVLEADMQMRRDLDG